MHNADPPLGDPNLGDVLAMPPSTRAEFSSADAPAWQPMVDRSTVAAGGRLSLPPVPPSAPSDAGSVAGEHRDETLESASRRHLQLPHASPPQTPPRQSYTYRSSGHHGGGGGPGDHAVGGGAPPPADAAAMAPPPRSSRSGEKSRSNEPISTVTDGGELLAARRRIHLLEKELARRSALSAAAAAAPPSATEGVMRGEVATDTITAAATVGSAPPAAPTGTAAASSARQASASDDGAEASMPRVQSASSSISSALSHAADEDRCGSKDTASQMTSSRVGSSSSIADPTIDEEPPEVLRWSYGEVPPTAMTAALGVAAVEPLKPSRAVRRTRPFWETQQARGNHSPVDEHAADNSEAASAGQATVRPTAADELAQVGLALALDAEELAGGAPCSFAMVEAPSALPAGRDPPSPPIPQPQLAQPAAAAASPPPPRPLPGCMPEQLERHAASSAPASHALASPMATALPPSAIAASHHNQPPAPPPPASPAASTANAPSPPPRRRSRSPSCPPSPTSDPVMDAAAEARPDTPLPLSVLRLSSEGDAPVDARSSSEGEGAAEARSTNPPFEAALVESATMAASTVHAAATPAAATATPAATTATSTSTAIPAAATPTPTASPTSSAPPAAPAPAPAATAAAQSSSGGFGGVPAVRESHSFGRRSMDDRMASVLALSDRVLEDDISGAHLYNDDITSQLMLSRCTVASLETQLAHERQMATEREASKAAECAMLAQRMLELEAEIASAKAGAPIDTISRQRQLEESATERLAAAAERMAAAASAQQAVANAQQAALEASAQHVARSGHSPGRDEATSTSTDGINEADNPHEAMLSETMSPDSGAPVQLPQPAVLMPPPAAMEDLSFDGCCVAVVGRAPGAGWDPAAPAAAAAAAAEARAIEDDDVFDALLASLGPPRHAAAAAVAPSADEKADDAPFSLGSFLHEKIWGGPPVEVGVADGNETAEGTDDAKNEDGWAAWHEQQAFASENLAAFSEWMNVAMASNARGCAFPAAAQKFTHPPSDDDEKEPDAGGFFSSLGPGIPPMTSASDFLACAGGRAPPQVGPAPDFGIDDMDAAKAHALRHAPLTASNDGME